MSHYIEICSTCASVISQCRCPSRDKPVRYGQCAKCKAQTAQQPNSQPQEGQP